MSIRAKLKPAVNSVAVWSYRARIVVFALVLSIFTLPQALFFPPKANAAISYVGASSVAGTATNAVSYPSLAPPVGTTEGDVMIMSVVAANPNGSAVIAVNGGGWTSVQSTTTGTGVKIQTFSRGYYTMEPASYQPYVDVGGSYQYAASMVVYRGVDRVAPVNVAGGGGTGSGSANIDATSITSTLPGGQIIGVFGMSNANPRTFTFSGPDTTLTERVDTASSTGGDDASIGVGDLAQVSAGATGNQRVVASGSGDWAAHLLVLKQLTLHMILFWEGVSPPSGWSFLSTFDNQLIRGDSPANYGVTGGATHTHTPTMTVGAPSASRTGNVDNSTLGATNTHVHNVSGNVSVAQNSTNIPVYRTLKMIRYNFGIPNVIPGGAIALFDNSPGIPVSGWTPVTAQNGQMIMSNSVTAGSTGGSDTHTHAIGSWPSLLNTGVATLQTNASGLLGSAAVSLGNHTHAAPSSPPTVTTNPSPNPATDLPPYIQPLLASANGDTPTLSVGVTAMFDGDPGSGWVIRSNVGGPYYQRLLRPNSSYAENLGSLNHTHPDLVSTSGAGGGTVTTNTFLAPTQFATPTNHTHTITASFANAQWVPPYASVVIAEKVNFILNSFQWYYDPQPDSTSNVVSTPWGSPAIAPDTAIFPLPVSNDAPGTGRELRLRANILVNNNALVTGDVGFKLEFKQDSDGVCTTGAWSEMGEIGSSSSWRYADSLIADGDPLSGSVLSPTSSRLGRYVKTNNSGTNPVGVAVGETIEYDFHIQHNNANSAARYSFRIVETGGFLLSQYGNLTPLCPTLSTKPEAMDQLRHGEFFDQGAERGFYWAN